MSTQELELPKLNTLAARRGEGMLVLVQNNQDKSVTINSINETLETMLGYGPSELINRKVETILGKNEAELIADDLEYDDSAADFGDIFARIRDVKLRRRLGDEIRVNCTLSRLMSQGQNAVFQLVVPNEQERIATDKLQEFINLSLDGRKELDPATGLPNYKTAKEFLPLLKSYFADSNVNIVFAMMRLDRFDKSVARYGEEACNQLLMHAYNCCRSTFRSHDLIFALSDRTLGVVLFDISRESARVVFNRLRWKIRNHRFAFGGKSEFSISTCIGFDLLDLEKTEAIFDRCEAAMAKLDANERNALVELGND
jgi:PAS domain S-box-containing protein